MLTREHHENQLAGIARLEARLSFRFAVLQRLLDRQMGRILARHGLSLAAYRVMLTIEAFGELAAADLVRLVAVDKALISRSSADLIEQGMIEARPDPASGRRKLLRLTPAGAARLAATDPDVDARNAGLDGLFTAEERAALEEALDRLTRHAARASEGDAAIQSAA
jgi:DNA-binding MarR family transcriptional regulator